MVRKPRADQRGRHPKKTPFRRLNTEKSATHRYPNQKSRVPIAPTVLGRHRTRRRVVMLLGHPVLFKSLCYVDGRWVHSDSASTVAVQNPADQEVIGHVPMLEAPQITQAVDAAQRAFESWRYVPVAKRATLLLRWHELVMRHQTDLAGILSI